jgi:hypothetical protein
VKVYGYAIAIAVIAAVVDAGPATARYTTNAKLRYTSDSGTSQWYSVDTSFLTGAELNNLTGSFRYSGFGHYAVLFWQPGQATVIKLEGLFVCGMEFTQSCMPLLGRMKGADQENRNWEVCTAWIC